MAKLAVIKTQPTAVDPKDFLLSIESWQRLRIEQRLSVAVSRGIVEAQVKALTG